MTDYDKYLAERIAKSGRKSGTTYVNPRRKVYAKLKKEGLDISYKKFSKLLETVAFKVWDKVYEGYHVAIPFLFNMEVVPNNIEWPRLVDWKRTHNWWQEDEDAFRNRLLLRRKPTRNFLRIRHSTISRSRKQWYYSLMLDVRPCKGMVREIETRYNLQ